MDNSSIDLSLLNIWRSWFKFRKGKKKTQELEIFSYFLEENLRRLHFDLVSGGYQHGEYHTFMIADNKPREIRVASMRDRVVHRLLYEYLYEIYDKIFIFDVWSCRQGKGLLGAIERMQKFLKKYPNSFVWRADIKKFFDNVDQKVLLEILFLRINDPETINLLKEVITSYSTQTKEGNRDSSKGIPIGNLTSQIFANIYLNELDRFVKHIVKPKAYLRYGDDFVIISEDLEKLKQIRKRVINFLQEKLQLEINAKSDIMVKARWGLKFLGVEIFSQGRRLNKKNWQRAKTRVNWQNVPSYNGLVKQHSQEKRVKEFSWIILEKLNNF